MRNYRLDFIRALAILMVILGHSIIIYDPAWGVIKSAVESQFCIVIKRCIDLIQMPLFYAISGYVFYLTMNKSNFPNFFLNKVKRLLVPFIFVGLFFMLPIKLFLAIPGCVASLETLFFFLVRGNNVGHLWFLPTLFIVFIISEIILRENKSFVCDSIVAFFAIIASVIPSKFSIGIPYMNFVLEYFHYFFFGFLISKYGFDGLKYLKALFIVIPVVFLVGYALVSYSPIIMSTCLVFIFFVVVPNYSNLIIGEISKNSFGLYLFHSPLIYFSFTYFPNLNPFYMFLINFILFGFVAYLITKLIRKTKFKFIIGE